MERAGTGVVGALHRMQVFGTAYLHWWIDLSCVSFTFTPNKFGEVASVLIVLL